MSALHLPAELLDHIVDHLHNIKSTLRNCCLVSKSWIPRARKHLFAEVWFNTGEHLESWKEAFPDPSTSPACYTKTLLINCPHIVTTTDAEPGGWIRSFSHVVHLTLGSFDKLTGSLLPFHGLSPIVKSLHVGLIAPSPSQTFNLILSFPLLEDLTMTNSYNGATDDSDGSTVQPSNPPTFTGSLKLVMIRMEPITRQLLSLPGGIHFRKIALRWDLEDDISLTTALVEGCSHTLESLEIICDRLGAFIRHLRSYW